jgi:hypothetical protein
MGVTDLMTVTRARRTVVSVMGKPSMLLSMNPTIRVVGLCMLSALLACGSHSSAKLPGDASLGANDGAPGFGDAAPGPGDVALRPDGSALSDAGGCRGLELPDFDCDFGTPITICVARQGGWAWDYTCPEPPRDAAPSLADAEARPADCDGLADRLVAEMSPGVGSCTAVVRLDYTSLKIISHAFVCGKYASVDEASARQSANAVPLPTLSKPGAGTLLSGNTPTDQWLFYTYPGDFGGVALVSTHTGLATFVASINWMGGGDILHPKTWSTTDLGKGCNTPAPRGTRFFNLTGGQVTDLNMLEASHIVLSTALPTAFQHWGSTFGTTVLLYPRVFGSFDPKVAEFIVLLDGGWLE